MEATRKEHDFLGELDIPDHLYYGIQTFRAVDNFDITGIPISKEPLFIKALGYVKKAAAMAKDLHALSNTIEDLENGMLQAMEDQQNLESELKALTGN